MAVCTYFVPREGAIVVVDNSKLIQVEQDPGLGAGLQRDVPIALKAPIRTPTCEEEQQH